MSLDEYYRRLELPRTASAADVKRAYRRLRSKYHPDRNKGREATVEPVFKRIQEAFEILIGERKPPASRSATASAEDRGKEAPSRERHSPPSMRGANCRIELFVPLETAIHGGGVEISYPVNGPSRQSYLKSETVEVPPGAWDGQRLVVEHGGHPGPNGGPPGDAIFSVVIVSSAAFRRNGLDLACEIQVDFVTATLGGGVEAQILGRARQITIPPNAQPGSTIRLSGQGLTDRNGLRGDLMLQLTLIMPAATSHLTDDERQQLREMFANAERRAREAIPTRARDDS
ncbi:DnaJ C-terminal domain-containing protein [Trinickia fusca]|uniref:J domain-containing protein n=1 Tax=Trinickia fusca TaxID=2419777 RepID=A0A494X709_9BURK|nr:DnaJ C-terminal domain-containing protein [Trinickia fusca]RKP46072.1 J domain-containing protein [Trinickia fusca]